ncbi:chloride channel protein [Methanothermococcus okinawensis]|uniref:Cl-channel voltage-gated family protein n=1 Tax=Methanothermococcus okinawensis (strain DSM 14208 / JCM 11175 / IH1) TaxID=647113 RepID=F8AN81_METOI|nr:chloride channel protein [Methanothermococcus okinawensis]AEH07000.1 Cl- channel voltage-gated family protein [Methanothermococcus okinawensis IH1]
MDRKQGLNVFKHIFKWTIISAIIGVVGSLSSIIITKIIILLSHLSHNNIYLIPIVLAFAGYLVDRYPYLKGPGVDRTLNAYNNKILLNPFIGFLKVIISGIVIGVGGSGGKVGPSIQASASFADYIFKKFKLKNRKALFISGIAGGISGDLCAPLGSAIFAAEIVKREGFEYISCFPAIMSSIFGYLSFFWIFKQERLFTPPIYHITILNLPNIFLCAIFCGAMSYIYIHTFDIVRTFFNKLPYPQYLKSFIGGCIVASIGYFIPQSLGLGAELVHQFLTLKYGIVALFLILFGKIFTTSFTVGSGTPGGLVIPSIVIGSSAGALYGTLIGAHTLVPFVVVGIATSLSAMANVPLASAILCTEIFGFDCAIPSAIGALMGFQLVRWKTIYENIKF